MKLTPKEEAIYAAALVAAQGLGVHDLDRHRDERQQDRAERDMQVYICRAMACVELHRQALKRPLKL